eukprot:scaffold5357_cov135-Isochrysis_galbana.AAC.2
MARRAIGGIGLQSAQLQRNAGRAGKKRLQPGDGSGAPALSGRRGPPPSFVELVFAEIGVDAFWDDPEGSGQVIGRNCATGLARRECGHGLVIAHEVQPSGRHSPRQAPEHERLLLHDRAGRSPHWVAAGDHNLHAAEQRSQRRVPAAGDVVARVDDPLPRVQADQQVDGRLVSTQRPEGRGLVHKERVGSHTAQRRAVAVGARHQLHHLQALQQASADDGLVRVVLRQEEQPV